MMTRRKIILTLTIILIIAIGVALYFALTREAPGGDAGTGTGQGSPFGPSSSSGISDNNTPAPSEAEQATPSENNVVSIPRLRHLTLVPTSGDVILTRQIDVIRDRVKVKETEYSVRYVDRASGHVFDIKTNALAPEQISNATIPKVYEALFTPDGNSFIARLLSEADPDQILSYFVTMKDKKTTATSSASGGQTVNDIGTVSKAQLKETSGAYLPPDIKELAVSPSGAKILSLFYTENGGKLVLSNTNGASARTILTHPLREWQISMPSETKAVIATKPSGIANGYAYTLDLASGSLTKIMGGIAGLTVLPARDGTAYLGAGAPDGVVKFFVYSPKEDKQTMLPFPTFPEKCVWSNTNKSLVYCAVPESILETTYPDSWYQGRVSFTDDIWKINVETGETNIISNLPEESGQQIDAVNLRLAGDDSYLTFINKIDLTLWGLNLAAR